MSYNLLNTRISDNFQRLLQITSGNTILDGYGNEISFLTNSISASTFYIGDTNIYDIFVTSAGANDITRIQPGANILTGGSPNFPLISIVNSPSFNSISASGNSTFATLSASTLFSGGTNLYNVIRSEITGNTSFNFLSATTISASTIFSGNTNLSDIFHQKAGYLLQKYGSVNGVDFSGVTKIYTVNFSNNFPDNSYTITITGEDTRVWTITNKNLSGFTINSNSITDLTGYVYWNANEIGEGYK